MKIFNFMIAGAFLCAAVIEAAQAPGGPKMKDVTVRLINRSGYPNDSLLIDVVELAKNSQTTIRTVPFTDKIVTLVIQKGQAISVRLNDMAYGKEQMRGISGSEPAPIQRSHARVIDQDEQMAVSRAFTFTY